MCYSERSSIITFFSGMGLTLYLFFKGNKYEKHLSIFAFVFIQMQLAEYLMWKDQKCNKTNHYATIYAHFILLFQPISILLGGLYLKTFDINKNYIYLGLLITLIPLVEVIILYLKNTKQLCSLEEEKGYLEWNFVDGTSEEWKNHHIWIYGIFIFLPWIFMKDKFYGILSLVILLATLLLSFNNNIPTINRFEQWESKWCYGSVLYPLIFVVLKLLQ